MEILVKRIAKKETYTIGRLYIDGKYFCDTIEDKDRGLNQKLPLEVNKSKKKPNETAIPVGKYKITLNVKSPRFSQKQAYAFCNGCLPRLIDVPAFDGVLIHIGNTANDSSGCIIVGENKVVGKVINSAITFRKLYEKLKSAKDQIWITIS